MTHIALYRKFRPEVFDDIVGQEPIKRAITNQILQKRLSHAYLFNGPRGTGKTSMAKILSRTVNCENSSSYNPCNNCDACIQIKNDTYMDVIEMDAASHNGVDDIREILNIVKFSPSQGKKKVIIIDEVHMLSKEAFNALLKTLEEPPSYMLFVLATTEIHKVPETIISRCQNFNFKRIANSEIEKHLVHISEKEKLNISKELIRKIADSSGGAMRDAISDLERLSSISTEQNSEIGETMNLLDTFIEKMITALSDRDLKEALLINEKIESSAIDVNKFIKSMLEKLKNILLCICEKKRNQISTDDEFLKLISSKVGENFCLESMEVLMSLGAKYHFDDPINLLNYAVSKICIRQKIKNVDELALRIENLEKTIENLNFIKENHNISEISEENESSEFELIEENEVVFDNKERKETKTHIFETVSQVLEANDREQLDIKSEDEKINLEEKNIEIKEKWQDFISMFKKENLVAFKIMSNTNFVSLDEKFISIGLIEENTLHKTSLNSVQMKETILKLLEKFFGISLEIKII